MPCKEEEEVLISFASASKSFPGRGRERAEALKPLSFTLKKGRSLAVLGPNGAGKTTMIRLILGVLLPSSGELRVFGEKINSSAFEVKKRIGVVIEEQTFFLDMSAWDYLALFGELFQVDQCPQRAAELLRYMELWEDRHKKLKEYSTGMKKKLNIIQACLHSPALLILDEPFSGLDPIGISLTTSLLKDMRKRGTTLLLSSHILSEIDDLVEDLLIIKNGELKALGSREELWKSFGEGDLKRELRLQFPQGSLPELQPLMEKFLALPGTELNLSYGGGSIQTIYERVMGYDA